MWGEESKQKRAGLHHPPPPEPCPHLQWQHHVCPPSRERLALEEGRLGVVHEQNDAPVCIVIKVQADLHRVGGGEGCVCESGSFTRFRSPPDALGVEIPSRSHCLCASILLPLPAAVL